MPEPDRSSNGAQMDAGPSALAGAASSSRPGRSAPSPHAALRPYARVSEVFQGSPASVCVSDSFGIAQVPNLNVPDDLEG